MELTRWGSETETDKHMLYANVGNGIRYSRNNAIIRHLDGNLGTTLRPGGGHSDRCESVIWKLSPPPTS